jgi:copper chaperone CopZ
MTTSTYRVDGMTCEHCVRAVKQEVGAIAGVTSVDVVLVAEGTSTVTVESAAALAAAEVAAAIDEAGYALSPDGSLL